VEDVETQGDVITAYVQQAIAVEDAGTELPPPPEEELAPELVERLADDPELAASFDELTPGRQREYNLHVSGAKLSRPRERRVDEVVAAHPRGQGLASPLKAVHGRSRPPHEERRAQSEPPRPADDA
jgi:uncharacterized protein YdeI (YjbR/CyaY-like superfamily)